MIFLNTFCGSHDSIDFTPTAISDIKQVELKNGIYDDLYITKNPFVPEDPNLDRTIVVEASPIVAHQNNYSPLSTLPVTDEQQLDEVIVYCTNENVKNNCLYLYCTDGINSFHISLPSKMNGGSYGGYKVSDGESYNYIDVNGQKWICDIITLDLASNSGMVQVYVESNSETNTFMQTDAYSCAFSLSDPYIIRKPKLVISENGSIISINRVQDENSKNGKDSLSVEFEYQAIIYTNNADKLFIWDWETVLYAPFNGTPEAGNVDFTLENTTHIVIKRRKQDELEWKTIYVQPIDKLEDFDIHEADTTARSATTYEYAAVAVRDGIEGTYNKMTVESSFDKIYLVEKDQMYGTSIGDGYCDTTRNIPSAVTPLLNNKYPIYIRNTRANYDTGSLSLGFIDTETCPFNFDDKNRVPYQRKVMDFLCDAKPKLLKLPDGRMWLIMVTGNPTDTADNYYANRKINFEWTEIGDCESQRDLYNAGLLDVSEEWWVN